MRPGRPKQHVHNWKSEWHTLRELAVEKQKHIDETWFGIRIRPALVARCYRGNKIKHVMPILKKASRSVFIPMSGLVIPPNWRDGKQISYE